MRWREEWVRIESLSGGKKSGRTPYVTSGTTHKIWFCYYVPLDMSKFVQRINLQYLNVLVSYMFVLKKNQNVDATGKFEKKKLLCCY